MRLRKAGSADILSAGAGHSILHLRLWLGELKQKGCLRSQHCGAAENQRCTEALRSKRRGGQSALLKRERLYRSTQRPGDNSFSARAGGLMAGRIFYFTKR